jgi:glycosyltransferase involved in cell wall biosynthesis
MDAGIPVLRFFHPRLTGAWAAMRRANADIYYSCCADPVVFMVAAFARRHNRRAVFWVASDADCDPKRTFFRLRGKKGQRLRLARLNYLYRTGLRDTHLVLAQTTLQQEMMLQNYGKRSLVVPSLVDVNPVRQSFEQRDIPVLWAATMRTLKRPELAIELAERLPHLRFALAGGPAPEDAANFDRVRARAAGVRNVELLGFVPPTQINGYFARARVLINTSAVEGFPNTYLQAWAEGIPVITFNDPDDLIRRHGLGVTVGSLEEMQRAIETLATDAGKWREVSERCRRYFDSNFGPEQTVGVMARALRECL